MIFDQDFINFLDYHRWKASEKIAIKRARERMRDGIGIKTNKRFIKACFQRIRMINRHINEILETKRDHLMPEYKIDKSTKIPEIEFEGPKEPTQNLRDILVKPLALKTFELKVLIHDGTSVIESFPHEKISFICCNTKKKLEIYAERKPKESNEHDKYEYQLNVGNNWVCLDRVFYCNGAAILIDETDGHKIIIPHDKIDRVVDALMEITGIIEEEAEH